MDGFNSVTIDSKYILQQLESNIIQLSTMINVEQTCGIIQATESVRLILARKNIELMPDSIKQKALEFIKELTDNINTLNDNEQKLLHLLTYTLGL